MIRFRMLGTAMLALLVATAAYADEVPDVGQSPAALSVDGGPTQILLTRMTHVNPGLRSYKADLHAEIALKTFPYINPTFDGNVYFKAPNRQAAVFDTVPALAAQFKKVYPNVPPPGEWVNLFTITPQGHSNGQTSLRLVPIKNGRVEHLDVEIDDASAMVVSYTWTYKDGGYITFHQSFKTIGGNYVVQKQIGHVELPSYKADVTNTLSNYKLNIAIDDDIFVGS
ncbi:MAG TPA: hypothetical protein VGZ00_10380 [Candidatus Baltobacteraceae bacterium]|nr:hypothetical protein [Candidatus Baltobacteraceae bacterium]